MDQQPKQYQIPTHLKTPDVLQIGGYQLTMRQFVIAVLAFLAVDQVWYYVTLWHWALLLRLVCCGALALLAFLIAVGQVGGLGLERWLWVVWLPYHMQPHTFLWRQLPLSEAGENTGGVERSRV